MSVCRKKHDIPKTNFLGYSFEDRYVLMMEGVNYHLNLYNKKINEGFYARRLYEQEETFINNPAMAIIKGEVIHENICNNKRRKIIYIDLKEKERKSK